MTQRPLCPLCNSSRWCGRPCMNAPVAGKKRGTSTGPVSHPKTHEAQKLKLMRIATTRATAKYGTGGRPKTQGVKKVTLPKLGKE